MEDLKETQVLIFGREDLTTKGVFKKKNNSFNLSRTEFFKYLKENDLKINSCYIDITGEISNGKRFRCSWNNFIIGTSAIVKEFQNFSITEQFNKQ